MADNPFANFADAPSPTGGGANSAAPSNPFSTFSDAPKPANDTAPQSNPFESFGDKTTAGEAFAHGAERGAAPAAGGLVGAGMAEEVAAPAIAATAEIPIVSGGIAIGAGLAGAMGGGAAVAKAQQWALEHMPPEFVKALGLDKVTQAGEQTEHPYAEFSGEMVPSLAAFRPSLSGPAAAGAGANSIQKVMATQVGSRALPAAINAGQEAATEEVQDGKVDPTKVGIAAAIGALSNKQTAVGGALTGLGAGSVRGWQRAWTNRFAGPDEGSMQDITPEKPGPAPAGTPRIGGPVDPRDIQPGDAESPIPTEIIAAGRKQMREATQPPQAPVSAVDIDNSVSQQAQNGQPDQILARNNWPQPGTPVTLNDGEGPRISGVVHSGFNGQVPGAADGTMADGLHVTLDNGDTLSAFAHEIQAAGIAITADEARMAGLPASFATTGTEQTGSTAQPAPATSQNLPTEGPSAPVSPPAGIPGAQENQPAQAASQAVSPASPPVGPNGAQTPQNLGAGLLDAAPVSIRKADLMSPDGTLDMNAAKAFVSSRVQQAISQGRDVTLHTEGKVVPIVGLNANGQMMDSQGRGWGATASIALPKKGNDDRLDIGALPAKGDGTAVAPIDVTHPAHLDQASANVNTAPTDGQKEAGNYEKGHVTLQGLPITIENPRGSIRSGVGADGKPWQVQMPAAYGYIKGTTGADHEQVDAYIGPSPQSKKVFVVDQKDAKTGAFDEHKVMLGYDNRQQALDDYHGGFSDGLGPQRMGGVREMPMAQFKLLLKQGTLNKPIAATALPTVPAEPAPTAPGDIPSFLDRRPKKPEAAPAPATVQKPVEEITTKPNETGPNSNNQAAKEIIAPKLPKDLAHASPRYFYGDKGFSLNFASDIDRAAYITAQKMKSKRDADFLKFVQGHTGMTEAQVRAHGAAVRDAIKAQAKDAEPGKLDIPEVARNAAEAPKQPDWMSTKERPELGPLWTFPKDDMSRFAILRRAADEKLPPWSLKAPIPTQARWLVKEGYGVSDKGGKVTLTDLGRSKLAELSKRNDEFDLPGQEKPEAAKVAEAPATPESIRENIKALLAEARPLSDKGGLTAAEAKRYAELMRKISDLHYEITNPLTVEKVPPAEKRMSTLTPETVVAAHRDLFRSKPIYDAITDAAHGVAFNADTQVDTIMRDKNPDVSPEQFYDNFSATRDALRKAHGDTIKLYRAEGKQAEKPTKNWATTPEYAKQFGSNIVSKDVPVDDVLGVNVGLRGGYHELIVGKPPERAAPAPAAATGPSARDLKVGDQLVREGDGSPYNEGGTHTVIKITGNPQDPMITLREGMEGGQQTAIRAVDLDFALKGKNAPQIVRDGVTLNPKAAPATTPAHPENADKPIENGEKAPESAQPSTAPPATPKEPEAAPAPKRVAKITDVGEAMPGKRADAYADIEKIKKGTPDKEFEALNKLTLDAGRMERGVILPPDASPGTHRYIQRLDRTLDSFLEAYGPKQARWDEANSKAMARRYQDLPDTVKKEAADYISTMETLKGVMAGSKTVSGIHEALRKAIFARGDVPMAEFAKLPSAERSKRTEFGSQLSQYESNQKFQVYRDDRLPHSDQAEPEDDTTPIRRPAQPLDKIKREGLPDRRNGKDVGAEDFRKAFGFRGVEFGNWVTGAERQRSVNVAFDALHDLAETLGIPPEAISMGGRIGLAFGSRGQGRHAAHYEEVNGANAVINLTKTRGDGTVAHEWGHALDYTLRKTDGGEDLLRDINATLTTKWDKEGAIRTFENLLQGRSSISGQSGKKTALEQAERYIDELWRHQGWGARHTTAFSMEGNKLGADYWGKTAELFARSFEAMVYDRMKAEGQSSPYIVNKHVAEGEVSPANGHRGTPYPTSPERVLFDGMWQKVFDSLEWKDGKPVVKKGFKSTHGATMQSVKNALDERMRALKEPSAPKVPAEPEGTAVNTRPSGGKSEPAAPREAYAPAKSSNPVAQAFREDLSAGKSFKSITEARARASEILGEKVEPGTEAAKKAEEGIELGVVLAARDIIHGASKDPGVTYDKLVDLYNRQPNLGTRSSTSIQQQAYSTPVPLAFLADSLAGIGAQTTVYEPSAGNGALLLTASPDKVTANELNPGRADALRQSLPGAKVTSNDAADFGPAPRSQDAVIANPPFGVVKDAQGESRTFQIDDRYSTSEIDHAIALKALGAMKNNGRAVLLVGGINKLAKSEEARSNAYNSKAKRQFYLTLYGEYNVTDHFTVAGELYAKQGAGWPVDVIVIDGRGKSSLRVPAADVPRTYDSWDGLKEVMNGQLERPGTGAGDENGNRPQQGGRPAPGDVASGERSPFGVAAERDDEPGHGEPGGVQPPALDREPSGGQLDQPQAGEHQEPAADKGLVGRDGRAGLVEGEKGPSQVPYKPRSSAEGLQTLVPYNMQDAIHGSLDRLANRLEGEGKTIDSFVADKLGYKNAAEISKYLSAEQVDAVALAIHNMDKGAGFILGDQTGVGKGRVVAAVIRYAIKEGKTPIFVTEKPNLYADMYRDLTDTGIKEMLGRDVKPLMTNVGESIPLSDDGKLKLTSGTKEKHDALLLKAGREPGLAGHDVVFTTYNQMQTVKGQGTLRTQFLNHIAPGSIVVFDESHNAGGQGAQMIGKGGEAAEPEGRAGFARKLGQKAHGVVYSSATYAKRPDVMDLYGTTDMKLAVADLSKLGEAIQKGGVPMQQVVASMLADAGQYVRREKSFEGIKYNTPAVKVDRDTYNHFSSTLQAIQRFSEDHVKAAIKNISKDLKAEGQAIGYDNATGAAGASGAGFSQVMHNLIEQMLLSIKAETAARKAIEALKNGEKPVITVANTMGSFLQDFVGAEGLNPGDPVHINFNSLLSRYLERTRTISIKKPWSKEPATKHYLTDDELGRRGQAAYLTAKELIEGANLSSLPVSPIDHMLKRLSDAGYKASEITGRNLTMDYQNDGPPTLGQRPDSERSPGGRRRINTAFNNGDLDALILNQAGSTGLSLHASEKFKDQSPRRMIIAQAERNIDTHMQMLGRVNRTGQVSLPEYDQLVADVPAEKRPAAVLAKKMASLNANTTAARGSALTAKDVPDFMNQYGDEVAARAMNDMPEVHARLDNPIKSTDEGKFEIEGAMRKLTGRIPLLPIEEQEALYELLENEYAATMAQKDAAGENTLEAKTMDLDAHTLSSTQVVPPNGASKSPFAAPVNLEHVDIKRIGKPYPGKVVVQKAAASLGMDDPFEKTPDKDLVQAHREVYAAGRKEAEETEMRGQVAFAAYKKAVVGAMPPGDGQEKMNQRLTALSARWGRLAKAVYVGAPVKLMSEDGNVYGVVTAVKNSGDANNPLALGKWKATFALADAARTFTIPFSQLDANTREPAAGALQVEHATHLMNEPTIKAFDNMQSQSREKRQVMTGNLLAAFDHVNGKGSIINYTDDEGAVRQGILMPRDYNYDKAQQSKPVQFRSPDQIADYLGQGHVVQDKEEGLTLTKSGDMLRVSTAAAKAVGGRYYLNKDVLDAVGRDFVSVGSQMRADVPMADAGKVIEALQNAGAVLQSRVEDRAIAMKALQAYAPKDERQEQVPSDRAPAAQQGRGTPPRTGPHRQIEGLPPGYHGVYTAEFEAQRVAVWKTLRARLNAVGLTDIAMQVPDAMVTATGQPETSMGWQWRKTIAAALTSPDPMQTLNHEVIHALRSLRLFSKTEWSILEQKAKTVWRYRYDIDKRYADRSESERLEESIAEAGRHYERAKSSESGMVARLFDRLRDALSAIASVFRGHGFSALRDIFGRETGAIFDRAYSGEVGNRYGGAVAREWESKSFGRRGEDDRQGPRGMEPDEPQAQRPDKPAERDEVPAPANEHDAAFNDAWGKAIAAQAKRLGWDGAPNSAAMFKKAFLMPKGAAKTELTRNAGLIQTMEEQRGAPFRQTAGRAIDGTGEEKVRGVAASMAAGDKSGVLGGDDQPTYNTADFADQKARAERAVAQDYEGMVRVAMGDEPAPYGVLPEFVYNEVAEQAEKRGDLNTLLDLGNRSNLITEATTMGQRIAAHGQRDELSAVDGINQVAKARAAAAKAKGADVVKQTANKVKDMQEAIGKSAKAAKSATWASFIEEIRCKDGQ